MNRLLFLSVATIFVMASCHKKEELPTPSGANTFSCQIEGKDFTPYLEPILVSPRNALQAKRMSPTGFVLQAKDSFNELEIYLATLRGPGTYALGFARSPIPYPTSNGSNYGFYQSNPPLLPSADPYNPLDPARYYTDIANTGTMTVTRFDTVARVAGGTFEFTARQAITGKLVHITNGRFDVKF